MGEVIYGFDFKAKAEKERGEPIALVELRQDSSGRLYEHLVPPTHPPTPLTAPETDPA